MALKAIFAILAAILWTWPAMAQEEPGAMPADEGVVAESEVDPAELVREAAAALAKVDSLAFKVKSHGIGGLATRSPLVAGTVRMARRSASEPFGWKFLVQGTTRRSSDEQRAPFATWFDGSTVRTLKEKDRVVLESGWENNTETMDVGAGWALTWAIRWEQLLAAPFEDEEAHPNCRHEGEAIVEGVRCDVVYVDYSELADPRLYDAWWYFGKEDRLPRRVELHFIDTGQGDGYSITTMSGMEAGKAIGEKELALAVPEDFEVRKAAEPERRQRRASRPAPSGPQMGVAAPDWTLKDASGQEHTLSEKKGKVVVLDFWATWCPPCRAAMPGIQKIHEKYRGKDVEVFGVNCWESGDPAKYMKDNGFTYGLLLNGDEVASKYGLSGIPALFVIGKDGTIIFQQTGYSPELEESLEKAIDEGLAK